AAGTENPRAARPPGWDAGVTSVYPETAGPRNARGKAPGYQVLFSQDVPARRPGPPDQEHSRAGRAAAALPDPEHEGARARNLPGETARPHVPLPAGRAGGGFPAAGRRLHLR